MEVNWVNSKFYTACQWICQLACLNLLWILFAFGGLIIFGLMPATAAMFTVLKRWVMGEAGIPLLRTFITAYQKEFIGSNLLGLPFAGAGYIIYFNYNFLQVMDAPFQTVLLVSLISTTILYLITAAFIFPVYVHYDLKPLQYIKVASVIGIRSPQMILILVLGLVLLYHLFYFIPGLIPFFGMSATGLIVMGCGTRILVRAEK